MRYLRTNTATRITVGPFLDKTDGITPETAITVTACKLTFVVDTAGVPTLVLDTNPTASGGSNDMVHVSGDDAGFYDLELSAADTNYLGRAMLALTDAATHCPVFHEFTIVPAMIYDSLILGTDVVQADVIQNAGTGITAASGIQEVKVASVANSAITAAAIATGAIDADALAADAVDEILDEQIGDGTVTMRQALRVILAGMAGKLSGAATTTVTIRNLADSADVVVATVDSNGNRSAVTVTP